jgi:hypothetical protein
MDPGELRSHLDPELGIEIRKGFVHQEGFGVADDRPAYGDALTLTARKGHRLAVHHLFEAQHASDLGDAPLDGGLVGPPQLQSEPDVLRHRHVGVNGIVLKDHREIALFGGQVGHELVADPDLPGRDVIESRQKSQDR